MSQAHEDLYKKQTAYFEKSFEKMKDGFSELADKKLEQFKEQLKGHIFREIDLMARLESANEKLFEAERKVLIYELNDNDMCVYSEADSGFIFKGNKYLCAAEDLYKGDEIVSYLQIKVKDPGCESFGTQRELKKQYFRSGQHILCSKAFALQNLTGVPL
jgi:hypothetical protein